MMAKYNLTLERPSPILSGSQYSVGFEFLHLFRKIQQ